ncbi:hypothetical protein P7H12_03930 [Paenibacillus larvae]|nr:hypothetical protein [Paenibacillus larvae]MDT2262965.1 hypothetical protein [Paenibacillus larvae]
MLYLAPLLCLIRFTKSTGKSSPKGSKNPFNQCKGSESSKELTAAIDKATANGKTKITIILPVRYGEHGDYDLQ